MIRGYVPRLFGFRGRDRDAERDERRFAPLRLAMRSTLSSMDRECAGLTRRVEEGRGRAADLMGNGSGGDGQRDGSDERDLRDAERMVLAGDRRLARVEAMRDLLRTMDDLLRNAEAVGRGASVLNHPRKPTASA